MKITRAQLRSIIKEAVSVDRLKALEGRPHKIYLDAILPAAKRKEMHQDAYAEGDETPFSASESPDSDPDEPYWTVYSDVYAIQITDYADQKEAEAVADALNAEYHEYLRTQDMGDFGFASIKYSPADHAS